MREGAECHNLGDVLSVTARNPRSLLIHRPLRAAVHKVCANHLAAHSYVGLKFRSCGEPRFEMF